MNTTEEPVNLMTMILSNYRWLGKLKAEKNWIKCKDPNEKMNESHAMFDTFVTLKKHIRMLEINLDLLLSDEEMHIFKNECEITETNALEEYEIIIERKNRPMHIGFNMKAIVIKTTKSIPEDILIGLSYGWKFLYPFVTNDKNLHEILAQLELCIDESIPPLAQHEVYAEISRQIGNYREITLDTNTQWLRFLAHRASNFFENNKDVFATRSDKGGHTVIIDVIEYERCILDMLNNSNYTMVIENPLEKLVTKEERLIKIYNKNHRTSEFVKNAYEPATKILAQMYGLPKVHKEKFCLRPITAMRESPGHAFGRIFDRLLNMIFPRTHFHVKDTYEMVEFLEIAMIKEEDILVSFDVMSMYTNIPRKLAKEIIMRKQNEFYSVFGMGKRILTESLDFLLIESTFFTALGNIYRQNEGLPMGGCVSTTIARLVMDEVAKHLLLHEPSISFIRIFVDDTMAAMRKDRVENALKILNEYNPNMSFTHEIESPRRSINFLNITLYREKHFIMTNWYRKHFASGRLLPYFSSHKRTTVIGTGEAFLKTVLRLSDPFFFSLNKPRIIETLRWNGYPETTIEILMNKHYTLTKTSIGKPRNTDVRYKIFPHAICESSRIKKILHKHKYNDIVFAESTKNTKINFVRTGKMPTPLSKRGNVIVKAICNCKRKMKLTSTKFNENGEMASNRLLTQHKECNGKIHAFNEVVLKKGLSYRKQTDYLLRYAEWKHRDKCIETKGMPNYNLMKILKKREKRKNKSTYDK